MMYLCPTIGVLWHIVKSILNFSKGPMTTITCYGVGFTCIFFIYIWHIWKFLTASTQSLKMYGKKYPTRKMSFFQPRKMTATSSSMEIIEEFFYFLTSKEARRMQSPPRWYSVFSMMRYLLACFHNRLYSSQERLKGYYMVCKYTRMLPYDGSNELVKIKWSSWMFSYCSCSWSTLGNSEISFLTTRYFFKLDEMK